MFAVCCPFEINLYIVRSILPSLLQQFIFSFQKLNCVQPTRNVLLKYSNETKQYRISVTTHIPNVEWEFFHFKCRWWNVRLPLMLAKCFDFYLILFSILWVKPHVHTSAQIFLLATTKPTNNCAVCVCRRVGSIIHSLYQQNPLERCVLTCRTPTAKRNECPTEKQWDEQQWNKIFILMRKHCANQ